MRVREAEESVGGCRRGARRSCVGVVVERVRSLRRSRRGSWIGRRRLLRRPRRLALLRVVVEGCIKLGVVDLKSEDAFG